MSVDTTRLEVALASWEAEWRRLRMRIADEVARGASDDEIDAAERASGLRFPQELRTWFKWHNGNGTVPWAGYEAMPGLRLASLEHAVSLRAESRATLADLDVDRWYPPTYFPIAMGGGYLVVDTAGPLDAPAPVDIVDPHVGLPADPPRPVFLSITDFVETVVHVCRHDWIFSDPDAHFVSIRLADLPPDLATLPIW